VCIDVDSKMCVHLQISRGVVGVRNEILCLRVFMLQFVS